MNSGYMTLKDIASMEEKSLKTIRRLVAAEKLKVADKNGKLKLVLKSDYENWKNDKNRYSINDTSKLLEIKEDICSNLSEFIDVKRSMKQIDGWNSKKLNGYKFIDIFSGAGGLSCGMVMAGFEPVVSVEILPQAVETYKHNFINSNRFPNDIVINDDIKKIEVKKKIIQIGKKEKVDMIIGGFPCQGFSMSGNRIAVDERNSLYSDMLDVVKEVKPKIIIMENVEGLRSMLDGKVERKIIDDYQKIGYHISIRVLNAASYGVPQTRKRVIFIANKMKATNYYPKEIYSEDRYQTIGDAIEKFIKLEERVDINHIFTKHRKDMIKRLKAVKEGESLYKNYSDAWKKSPWDKPSCTIKENHGGVNIHPKLPRVLTPRELAALQSFPDDFIFKGVKKWQLVQIGNAVPPIMGKAIGLAALKMLEKTRK